MWTFHRLFAHLQLAFAQGETANVFILWPLVLKIGKVQSEALLHEARIYQQIQSCRPLSRRYQAYYLPYINTLVLRCQGTTTLTPFTRRGGPRMPDTEVYACFRDLLESLRLLHTQCKLVHGDIKPANIRFSKAEGASFIDFGSAHQLGTKHVAQTTASPIYMPPEVILGKADSHTQASDMYALALVTYQLIQQEFPFDKERVCVNEAMFKDAVKCGSRESVPDITTSPRLKKVSLKKVLQRVLHKMLHDKPSARYGSVEDVLDDLDDLDVSPI